jgi:hypothetical protein
MKKYWIKYCTGLWIYYDAFVAPSSKKNALRCRQCLSVSVASLNYKYPGADFDKIWYWRLALNIVGRDSFWPICVHHKSYSTYMRLIYIPLSFVFYKRVSYGSVGIATGYGLDDRGIGVRVPVGAIFFSPRHPDRFWRPPSLLFNGYRGLVSRGG